MSNIFGGKGKALYVPMSEIEQEFISRLVESNDLHVIIHDWGHVDNPVVSFGDKNLHVAFKMFFDRPNFPMAVHFFDLELKTRSGVSLFRQKMNTEYGGNPLTVMQGLELDLVWDIAIKNIDPNLIKQFMPQTTGLTSRLQDKTTGDITVFGNMKLDQGARKKALDLHRAEQNLPLVEAKMREEWRAKKKAK